MNWVYGLTFGRIQYFSVIHTLDTCDIKVCDSPTLQLFPLTDMHDRKRVALSTEAQRSQENGWVNHIEYATVRPRSIFVASPPMQVSRRDNQYCDT